MNFRVSQKLLSQCIQRNRRLLIVQSNVNKCGVAYYSVNFHQKNKYNPSHVSFTKNLLQKNLTCTSLCMNFQRRNISDKDVIKDLPEGKEMPPASIADSERKLNVEEYLPDFIVNMHKDSSLPGNFFVAPDFFNDLAYHKPILFIQDIILSLHHNNGLTWWGTIITTALVFRLFFLFPLGANQMRIKVKLQKLEDYMTVYKAKLLEEQKELRRHYGWPKYMMEEEFEKKVNKELMGQYYHYKIHPNKYQFLAVLELLVWCTTTFAIRNLCHGLPPSAGAVEIFRQLSFDGIGWFQDLTLPDQFYILPFAIAMINAFTLDAHKSFNVNKEKSEVKYIILNILNIALIPNMMTATSAVQLFWITNSSLILMQIYLLHTPLALRLLRVDSKKSHKFYYDLRKSKPKQIASK